MTAAPADRGAASRLWSAAWNLARYCPLRQRP
jgi:hypothetical protein